MDAEIVIEPCMLVSYFAAVDTCKRSLYFCDLDILLSAEICRNLQKFLNFPLTHSSAARYTVNLDRYLIVAFNSLISAWTIIMMWATFANVQNCQGKGEGGPRVIVH